MTVLAVAVRSMDNRLDIGAGHAWATVAGRSTVGRAGQHGVMRILSAVIVDRSTAVKFRRSCSMAGRTR
jgi:hypothetical protein